MDPNDRCDSVEDRRKEEVSGLPVPSAPSRSSAAPLPGPPFRPLPTPSIASIPHRSPRSVSSSPPIGPSPPPSPLLSPSFPSPPPPVPSRSPARPWHVWPRSIIRVPHQITSAEVLICPAATRARGTSHTREDGGPVRDAKGEGRGGGEARDGWTGDARKEEKERAGTGGGGEWIREEPPSFSLSFLRPRIHGSTSACKRGRERVG